MDIDNENLNDSNIHFYQASQHPKVYQLAELLRKTPVEPSPENDAWIQDVLAALKNVSLLSMTCEMEYILPKHMRTY